MARISKTKITGTLDENGLKRVEFSSEKNWGEEPPYIKVYFEDILYLRNISKKYFSVMYALLKRISYAGDEYPMCVIVNKAIKKAICDEIGWKNPVSIDNAIQVFMKGGIIRRVERGVYQFNPFLFGRGKWSEVAKLRLSVNYDRNGRTFEAKIDDNTETVHSEEEFWKMLNQEA